jgi:spermidine synthase
VIPWRELDRAIVPGMTAPLVLLQRDSEYVMRLGPNLLMSSRSHGTEEILAELACARLATRDGARILIGGLGMGFTLAAALRHLGPRARVTVAELVPAVVEWNRGPLAHLANHPLDDRRVSLRETNVADVIRGQRDAFDAILLDVDNGPSGMTRSTNDWLYSHAGLRAAHRALREHGILGVWSVAPDRAFTRRLGECRFEANEFVERARRTKGGRHTLWLSSRVGGGAAPRASEARRRG